MRIITCPEWGAAPARRPAQRCPAASRIIFHHTAGHHPELGGAGESRAEAIAYARALQRFHMQVNGWDDSGHNFLVCRSGIVLQGRWQTVSAIQAGAMVISAHCPGQNEQVGIEHEHAGEERMTPAQLEAAAQLQAWIAHTYRRASVLAVAPHSRYYPTACPGTLTPVMPAVTSRAVEILRHLRRPVPPT